MRIPADGCLQETHLDSGAINFEPVIRITLFTTVAVLVAAWEYVSPYQPGRVSGWRGQANNLLLMVLSSLTTRIIVPITAVSVAVEVERAGFGLLQVVALPAWLKVTIAVILLDLVIWWQHRLFHAVPILWRLHRVHHADLHVDWTTGVRFHPIEHLASLAIKLVGVVLLGAPAVAVILFEVLLNASSMFNHANGRMRQSLDRFLQLFVVTPSLHRIHHSIDRAEQHTNFGFNFTLWDRLAGNLRTPEARQGAPLTQGVTALRRPIETAPLFQQLVMPFRRIAATPHTTDQRAN